MLYGNCLNLKMEFYMLKELKEKKILKIIIPVILAVVLCIGFYFSIKNKTSIYLEHPGWKGELVFISKDMVMNPKNQDKARVTKNDGDELILDWEKHARELFKKNDAGVYIYQRKI